MKNILVTGGTGFIGSHTIDALIKQGFQIRCLVRKKDNLGYIQEHVDKKRVELAYGDVTDLESLKKAVKGIDTIYHFVAISGKQNIPEKAYWEVNYQGTLNVLEAAKNTSIERLIHCSSVGVTGNLKRIPADESAPYNPTNTYERTKMEAEKAVLKLIKKEQFPAVVIRPAVVYGPRNAPSNMARMFAAIKNRTFFIVGSGNNYWHMSYVTDVAEAFVLAGMKKGIEGEIYIVAGEKPYTMNEIASEIAKAEKVPPPKHLPFLPTLVGSYFFALVHRLFHIKVPIEPSGVYFLTNHRAYDITKAKRILGYTPKVGLKEGIIETVKWYAKNGYL